MSRFLSAAALALGLSAAMSNPASAGLAVEFTSAVNAFTPINASAGFSFTTNSAVNVNALDYFLPNVINGGTVRLYDSSGTTLASALVLATDPTEATGGVIYNVHAIAPLTLAANTTYFVAADIPGGSTNVPVLASGLKTDPSITYGAGVLQFNTFGNPTTDVDGGLYNPSYFTPNFDLGPATVTPEPSTLFMAGTAALVGLAAYRRRKRAA